MLGEVPAGIALLGGLLCLAGVAVTRHRAGGPSAARVPAETLLEGPAVPGDLADLPGNG
jgi:hypothetical protein